MKETSKTTSKRDASIIFCITILSFSKLLINEMLTGESLFLKLIKMLIIIIALLIVTLILYGMYLQMVFTQRYSNSTKIYLNKSHWREVTIIILYVFVILYYFGAPFRVWNIFIIPNTALILFSSKENHIIVEDKNALYLSSKNYTLDIIKEISYDKRDDTLLLEVMDKEKKIETISINRIREKKIFKELYTLLHKYNVEFYKEI